MCTSKNRDTFISEEEFLDFLDGFFCQKEGVILGRGDDCAIIEAEREMLISQDIFLENVHFDMRYFSPYAIGYKALAVNISDILAMGGIPLGFTMSIMINKKNATRTFFEEFFKGMAFLSKKYNLYLAGGDISFSEVFGVDITIWGKKKERYLYRKTGYVGDLIFVTGDIGLSRAGLYALKMGIQHGFKEAKKAHLMPKIYYTESRCIVRNLDVTSLMDVSDGVLKDIKRLIPDNSGAYLKIDSTILHAEVVLMAQMVGEDPVIFATKGGEDYVLMGTVRPKGVNSLKKAISGLKIIGEVSEGGEFLVNGIKVKGGFDHFGFCDSIKTKESFIKISMQDSRQDNQD